MKTRTENKTVALVLAAAAFYWLAGCDQIGENGSQPPAPQSKPFAVSGDQDNTVENELVIKGSGFDSTASVRLTNVETGEAVVSGVGETRIIDASEMRVAINPSEFPAGDVDIQVCKGAAVVGSDTVSFKIGRAHV